MEQTTPRRLLIRQRHAAWYLPSSIGISLIVPGRSQSLEVWVTWGDYRRLIAEGKPTGEWQRVPRRQRVTVNVAKPLGKPKSHEVPESRGLRRSCPCARSRREPPNVAWHQPTRASSPSSSSTAVTPSRMWTRRTKGLRSRRVSRSTLTRRSSAAPMCAASATATGTSSSPTYSFETRASTPSAMAWPPRLSS